MDLMRKDHATNRARYEILHAAEKLGFGVSQIRDYTVRTPGEYRNTPWHAVVLECPCGTTKTLHVSRPKVYDGLVEHLRDHLVRDGLL
jgi:hypothetical protein